MGHVGSVTIAMMAARKAAAAPWFCFFILSWMIWICRPMWANISIVSPEPASISRPSVTS